MICTRTKIIDQPPIFHLNVNLNFNSNFKRSTMNKQGFQRPEIIITPPEGMIYYQKSRNLIRKWLPINRNSLLAIFQTLQKYLHDQIQNIIAKIFPHRNKDRRLISTSNKLFPKLIWIANSQIISHLKHLNLQERHILKIGISSKIEVK